MSALFGLDQSSRLVHVSEVPRGLACMCTCPVCTEALIARQGSVREHHFAHASGRDPCAVAHESLLHLFAKRVIAEAGALQVPMPRCVAEHFGVEVPRDAETELCLPVIDVERAIGGIRPDLLACTPEGVELAIEVAYSSFCEPDKIEEFRRLGLAALELDLRRFTPEAFDPLAVRAAVLQDLSGKNWLWPTKLEEGGNEGDEDGNPSIGAVSSEVTKQRLPEQVVSISGRWVSIKTFPSGDISVRVVAYDPDVVSLVKSIAKQNYGRYSPKWKSWNVPRWRAAAVRKALLARAQSTVIATL